MDLEYKRVRQSKKQKIWAFMRRNRQFRVGDLMMILDVDQDFLMPIFRALELCGYMQLEAGTDTFRDRIYRLNKDTGVRSPVILKKPCDIVRDLNTGEEFRLDGSHPVQIADRLVLLYALKHKAMFREQIALIANMHLFSAKTIRYLNEFTEEGIMDRLPRSPKIREERRTYAINKEKRDRLIRTLEESLQTARSA